MAGNLEGVLARIPGYGGYLAKQRFNEQSDESDMQQARGLQGLMAQFQQQQESARLKSLLEQSGGDVEAATAAAVKSGNIKAAHDLAPLVKLQQERKQREETPRLLADLNRQMSPQPTPAAPMQAAQIAPDIPVANPADAMVSTPNAGGGGSVAAGGSVDPRQARIAHLTALTMIPQYANNPIVQQRLQAEIDKLTNVKPMVEHQFSVGANQVQPHISFDEGKSWQPIPGSKPSSKFAKQVEAVAGPDNAAQPTADTLEMDAWRYLTDGTLPTNMGRGAQGSAQATLIRNRSSALAKEMGMTPDEIRFAQLTNKTQVQAIGQLAKAKAQILQFEKTASMNADLALQASEKVDRTGVPVLNRWIQAGRVNIQGDPEATAFNAANETFVSEYAKVMGGGYGAAATTEGAQQRAHTLLNTATNKEAYKRVVAQLKSEMDNRVKALNGQMEEERGNLRRGIRPNAPAAPGATPAAPPAAAPGGFQDGQTATGPNGAKIVFKGGQWQPVQ